jgi:hypothetical protein
MRELRLTESHCDLRKSGLGFDLMNPARCRRPLARDGCMRREADSRVKISRNRATAVDNAMTQM